MFEDYYDFIGVDTSEADDDTEDTIDPDEDNDVKDYENELNDELDQEEAFAFNR